MQHCGVGARGQRRSSGYPVPREYNVTHGVAAAQAYNVTMYVMAGLLVVGFVCNALIRPVDERHYIRETEQRGVGRRAAVER